MTLNMQNNLLLKIQKLGLDENDLVVVHTEEFEVSNYFVHTMKPLQIVLFFFSLETGSNGAKS